MDIQRERQVHGIAVAWAAANTKHTFTSEQVPSDNLDESDSVDDAAEDHTLKLDPLSPGGSGGMPSSSVPHPHQYDPHPEDSDTVSEDLSQSTIVKSQLAAALALRANTDLSLSSSRKRKQSSPQPCRELMEAMAGEQSRTEEASGPGPSKVMRSADQLETKNSKMLPVHCVIEPVDVIIKKDDQCHKSTEGYAIVPSTLLLNDLVRVALDKLDYPLDNIHNAKGVLQIRNWKALPFSAITDDTQATVGQIFGDLLSHITLKIRLAPSNSTSEPASPPETNQNNNSTTSSPPTPCMEGLQLLGFNLKKPGFTGLDINGPSMKGLSNAAQEIRLKLLQLLEKRGPTFLVSHGCPFSQAAVTQLLQGKYMRPIYMEKLQAFYQWYNIYNGLMDNTVVPPEKLDHMMPRSPSGSRHWRRPRTLFDPRHELPRLLAWYRDNPRPSRAEMEMYLAELNTMERRRNGHPLQYASIAIWFKNARAKYRGLGRVSPEPYDRLSMSPPGMDYVSDENLNMYDSDPELTENHPIMEPQPKKPELNGTNLNNKLNLIPTSSTHPVILSTPKPIPVVAIPSAHALVSTHGFSSFTPTIKVEGGAAPLAIPNMQLTPTPQTIKVKNERHVSSAGGVSAQPTPETASQVSDIRKIASGFGISLSPADAHAREQLIPLAIRAHIDARTIQEAAAHHGSILQPNGLVEKSLPGMEPDPKKQQSPPPPLQPKKICFKNLGIDAKFDVNSYKATRKRFNIHPAIEVPKLQAWFAVNPKPDRHSIEQYVAELNNTEFRRNQSKYDSRVVYVWFKNARAKYSRLKQRSPERPGEDDGMELDLSMHSSGSRDGI